MTLSASVEVLKVGVITSLAHVITRGLLKFLQSFEVKSYFSPS